MTRLPAPRRHAALLALVAVLLALAVGGSAVAGTEAPTFAAAKPARVVALVRSPSNLWRLTLLDARTLKPARPGWSREVWWSKGTPLVRSPGGTRVALVVEDTESAVLVVDAASGRVLKRVLTEQTEIGALYWLGGEGTRRKAPALLVSVGGLECGSDVCGDSFNLVWSNDPSVNPAYEILEEVEPAAALRNVLALAPNTPAWLTLWPGREIELPQLQRSAPFRVVADVGRDRLYVVSSAGTVAIVNRASTQSPAVAYHDVPLNGGAFEAAWAGSGRIALWGKDGLGTIDVRTWKTHAIAPGVSGALATPYGIAAWTKTADGIGVYKPDGTRRFQFLLGKQVNTAVAVGAFLYADTTGKTRYAIDLRTGKTTGPLPTTARIVTPSYVVIP